MLNLVHPHRIEPGPGRESVWDYPRPPRIDPADSHVVVRFGGRTVADTRRAVRVLETSQAPAYYVPRTDVDASVLRASELRTVCEWKGTATYVDLVVGDLVSANAAWRYEHPVRGFEAIAGYLAFYRPRVDEAWVDGEAVEGNAGDFYGGWITSRVVGPFKGGPGTARW